MKNKFILTLAVAFLTFACSTDSIITEGQDLNEIQQIEENRLDSLNITPLDSPQTSSFNGNFGSGPLVDESGDQGCNDFIAPFYYDAVDGPIQEVIDVYYESAIVDQDEINCIRKEFFNQFPNCIRFGPINNDPFHDVWVLICEPEISYNNDLFIQPVTNRVFRFDPVTGQKIFSTDDNSTKVDIKQRVVTNPKTRTRP